MNKLNKSPDEPFNLIDKDEFLKKHLFELEETMSSSFIKFGAWGATFLGLIFKLGNSSSILFWSALATSMLLLTSSFISKAMSSPSRPISRLLSYAFFLNPLYAGILLYLINTESQMPASTNTVLSVVALSIIALPAIVFPNLTTKLVKIYIVYAFTTAMLASAVSLLENNKQILFKITCIAAYAVVVYTLRLSIENVIRIWSHSQFQQSKLAKVNEWQREKIAQAELYYELTLAGRIQDSISDLNDLYIHGTSIKFYRHKHSQVGGDWMGMRTMANGDGIVCLFDATGKGLQASLVVHAIQAIWAQSLSDDDFNEEIWLQNVNSTLFHLGKSEPHTATGCLVRICKNTLKVVGAAHQPILEVIKENVQSAKWHGLPGGLLGISPKCKLSVFDIKLNQDGNYLLLSDGLCNSFRRKSVRSLVNFLKTPEAQRDQFIEDFPVEDDKSLIWIQSALTEIKQAG